jgi:hypothetical protein
MQIPGNWPCFASRSSTWGAAADSQQEGDQESDDQFHDALAVPEDERQDVGSNAEGRNSRA